MHLIFGDKKEKDSTSKRDLYISFASMYPHIDLARTLSCKLDYVFFDGTSCSTKCEILNDIACDLMREGLSAEALKVHAAKNMVHISECIRPLSNDNTGVVSADSFVDDIVKFQHILKWNPAQVISFFRTMGSTAVLPNVVVYLYESALTEQYSFSTFRYTKMYKDVLNLVKGHYPKLRILEYAIPKKYNPEVIADDIITKLWGDGDDEED